MTKEMISTVVRLTQLNNNILIAYRVCLNMVISCEIL